MNQKRSMQWNPIEDLPTNWQNIAVSELPPLVTVWNEQADHLRKSGNFQDFMTKMRREIAIETGVIERLYTIDRGITQLLIEQGIHEALIPHGTTDLPAAQVIALIRDQEDAVEGLFRFVGGSRELSTSYIKELHQVLTRHQATTEAIVPSTGQIVEVPLMRGAWKNSPNNPLRPDATIHEYSPPEQVASEMDNLIQWRLAHQHNDVAPEVSAAWLHHRFTQIHPFQDGNGRVARCLASLVFIQAGWFPLVLTRDDRSDYIAALEQADHSDLAPLIDLFAVSQKRAFIRSLSLSEQVIAEGKRTRAILKSITETIYQRQQASISEQCQKVEEYAATLFELASGSFKSLTTEIQLALKNVNFEPHIYYQDATAESSNAHWHRYQIIEAAKQQHYFANTRSYSSWVKIVINIESRIELLLSFHGIGHEYLGLLVCSAIASRKDATDDGESSITDVQPLSQTFFQFSYADELNNIKYRYKKWLEEVSATGLEYWREQL